MKVITIYFDESKKNKQVICPKYEPQCSITDIVCQITKSNLSGLNPVKNYHSFSVVNY